MTVLYTYILVRTDIPVVQQTVQACHAGILGGQYFNQAQPGDEGNLVILQVGSEVELRNALDYLENKCGIKAKMFYEPDYGPLGNTALCTEAVPEFHHGQFKHWKLWTPHYTGEVTLPDRYEEVRQGGIRLRKALENRLGAFLSP